MDTPSKLTDRLQTEGDKVSTFFSKFTGDDWRVGVYTESDTWDIRNVLAHLVTSEQGFLRLFESIRTGGDGVPDDFSIDRYNASQQDKVKSLTPDELIQAFRDTRSELCRWVAARSTSDLEKMGRHPFLGDVSLHEMIKMVYIHNQIHLRDIRKSFDNQP